MPLTKCPRCTTLFDKTTSPVCRGCIEEEEKDYDLIRDTIEGHPDLNAEGVAELSGVELKCVMRMMDSGKIATIRIGEKIECGRCGAPAISVSQRLCQSCLDKLNREMIEAKKKMKVSTYKKKDVEIGGYTSVRSTVEKKRRD